VSEPYLSDSDFTLYNGDAREVLSELPDESVHMCVTSPPFFGLRDYGVDGQIGLEATPEEWVEQLVAVFEQVRRVLRKDGTLWVECGDSYAHGQPGGGSPFSNGRSDGRKSYERDNPQGREKLATLSPGLKPKDLIGQPFLLAFALREAGWYWRNVCIWHKPNPMPESVRDRFTVSHSYVLLFSKSPRYFFDAEAVREESIRAGDIPGGNPDRGNGHFGVRPHVSLGPVPAARNARSVWTIATQPLKDEHYAAFPEALAERCIKAGTSERGCCPECGAPWVREMDVSYEKSPVHGSGSVVGRHYETGANNFDGAGMPRLNKVTETIGWKPSDDCHCYVEGHNLYHAPPPITCTVLDPFLGSGTTALVARRLGRSCIGIELNEAYCALAAQRTQQLSLEASA
jgi:DNA modification methylase